MIGELQYYKPIISSLRHRIGINKKNLSKTKSVKNLTIGLSNTGGRNHSGQITFYHKGRGNKKKFRIIDFKRLLKIPAVIKKIEYDPNRSAFIALINYFNGVLSYILAPAHIKVGNLILAGTNIQLKIGNSLPLYNIPLGSLIHNIELKPLKGGQLARAAGTYGQLLKKNNIGYGLIKLNSGEYRLILLNCFATLGRVSNLEYHKIVLGKAGASIWRNKLPTVRGIAMNPVDHPNGGRTPGGKIYMTPWTQIAKGKPTRNKKKKNTLLFKPRKK